MTDGTPGWFRDPTDPALARWHDGEKWTDHTLVIADQNPGEEPPPPVMDGDAAGGFAAADPDFKISRTGRVNDLPLWAKIAVPTGAVAIVVLLAVVLLGGGGSKDKTTTTDSKAASLDKAVTAARDAGLPTAISDARAGALIERICTAARTGDDTTQLGSDLGQLPAASTSEVRDDVGDLGKGASVRCPSDMAKAPKLINTLKDEAAVAFTTSTTSVTAPGTTGGTDSGAAATTGGTDTGTTATTSKSSKGKTTTTVKGKTTSTTAKPAPTTTLQQALPNSPCSSEGAHAQSKLGGGTLTCEKNCSGVGGSLSWREGSCPTTPTVPPTSPTSTPPTTPTTSGGTTGGTGGPTTGG